MDDHEESTGAKLVRSYLNMILDSLVMALATRLWATDFCHKPS